MQTIPNVATIDTFQDACTLGPIPTAQQISFVVANAAVIAQIASQNRDGTLEPWGPDLLLTPQTNTVTRAQGIRFKSAVSGVPARIVAQLIAPGDPVPGAGTPFTANLSATGSVSPVSTITRVTVLPATPADLQQVMLDLNATYPGIEWLCTYNASTTYWDVIGDPLVIESGTLDAGGGAGTWTVDSRTKIVVPNLGDYKARYTANPYNVTNAANASSSVAIDVNGTGPTGNSMNANMPASTPTNQAVFTMLRTILGVAAGGYIAGYWFSGGAQMNMAARMLEVTPVRIK